MWVEPRTRTGQTVRTMREEKPLFWDLFKAAGQIPENAEPPKPNEELLATIKGEQYDGEGGVWFECEVSQPKSTKGRECYVHIPAEQVLALLKLCKFAAAEQRKQAMTS